MFNGPDAAQESEACAPDVSSQSPATPIPVSSWLASCSPLAGNRSPASGIVDERAFESAAIFDEEQTVFLHSPVHFPAQVDAVSQDHNLGRSRHSRPLLTGGEKDHTGFLLAMVLVIVNHPLPRATQSSAASCIAHPFLP